MSDKEDTFRQERKDLTEERIKQLSELKRRYQELYDFINDIKDSRTDDMRHIALALTNLEQSCMWAVKGLTK